MSYASLPGQLSMALDEVRNTAYLRALEATITPESVVLDLGAGLGTLGLLAAKLGARRVYLVEPEDIVTYARKLVEANGLADRVAVLHGTLEDLELPERVDVITSVMAGNFLLSEDLLPTLFHARDTWLKPGGVLLPSEGVMEVVPVSHPELQAKAFEALEEPHLGLDVSCLREPLANTPQWGRKHLAEATPLAAPADLFALDFATATSTDCRAEAVLEATRAGTLHGWLGWFRMRLGAGWLSTSPFEPAVHWSAAYLPLAEPVEVAAGSELGFALRRPPEGDWTWTSRAGGTEQRQSSFFGHALTQDGLRAHARKAAARTAETPDGK